MLTEGSCYSPAVGAWTHLISVVLVPQQLCHINNRLVERLMRRHSQQQGEVWPCSKETRGLLTVRGGILPHTAAGAMFMQRGLDGRTSYLITGGTPVIGQLFNVTHL